MTEGDKRQRAIRQGKKETKNRNGEGKEGKRERTETEKART